MKHKTGMFMALMAVILLTQACSFAPEKTMHSGRPAEFPDMHLTATRYLLGVAGSEPIAIDAKEIEIYREAERAYITSAEFAQYDDAGKLLFSGSFDNAVVDTKTNDMTLSGNVVIRNYAEQFSITAESLQWNHEEQTVSSGDDTLVTINRKEHDILRGTGFHGDFATATFEFTSMEEGILHHE